MSLHHEGENELAWAQSKVHEVLGAPLKAVEERAGNFQEKDDEPAPWRLRDEAALLVAPGVWPCLFRDSGLRLPSLGASVGP